MDAEMGGNDAWEGWWKVGEQEEGSNTKKEDSVENRRKCRLLPNALKHNGHYTGQLFLHVLSFLPPGYRVDQSVILSNFTCKSWLTKLRWRQAFGNPFFVALRHQILTQTAVQKIDQVSNSMRTQIEYGEVTYSDKWAIAYILKCITSLSCTRYQNLMLLKLCFLYADWETENN